jgi:hypothetical protein
MAKPEELLDKAWGRVEKGWAFGGEEHVLRVWCD